MQAGVRRDLAVVARIEPGGGTHHKTAGLQGVVAHGDGGLFAEDRPHQGSGELGAVDLLPLGHQRKPRQGVVVLPAGQGADAPQLRAHHLQAGAIPLAPHHPLVVGGGELAPFKHHLAVGIDQQLGVVEAAAIALVDAQQHVHAVLTSGGGDLAQLGAGQLHRLVVEAQMGRPHQHRWLHKREIGVVGQKGFGEHDQLNRRLGGFCHRLQQPGQGALKAMQYRPDLGRRHHNRGRHGKESEVPRINSRGARPSSAKSKGPGVEDEGALLAMHQN